ncbi:cation transporting ATPase [Trichoderma citrinoviride]|uniref:P-type Na(+) transporter n=1 Tax=Trichoderma citrinoviride TaxID=58853 RepID=A0A2T4B8Q2_9HYPO|nr:cation transporting ATPase [Trichoderma citrinoviride]PTB65690.1 cation transporting ATPase [Trichoderma citrinoviride]
MAEFPKHPFLLTVEETAQALGTNVDRGLTSEQVSALQARYPKNELDVGGTIPWYSILAKQMLNAMIIVLVFAMALSFGIQDYIEGGVLACVIFLNVTIGFWQEYRAEKRMDALRALSSPSAMVLRDGHTQVIPNNTSATNMATSEDDLGIADRTNMAYATTTVQKGRGRGIAVATGMATEVGKIAASSSAKKHHRKAGRSMNWRKYGKAQPVVGLSKRIYDVVGKFLGLTVGTPLQRKLSALAYVLFGCAVGLALVVFGVNRFNMRHEVIIYATSLGIAIIPESLVAVLTITMVVAVTVMRKANVVVRDLSALEALGGVTNICSDKTGTLTEGAMIVRQAWIPSSHIYTVHDSQNPNDPTRGRVLYTQANKDEEKQQQQQQPTDEANKEKQPQRDYDKERSSAVLKFDVPDEKLNPSPPQQAPSPESETKMTDQLRAFLLSSALCNLATVRFDQDEEKWQTTGEPTEIALQVFAHRFGHGKKSLEGQGWEQVAEFPFDSSIKRMSVIYNAPEDDSNSSLVASDSRNSLVFTKGAVERILDLCAFAGIGKDQQPMTDELKETVLSQMNSLASQGQRVLAVAYRPWKGRFTAKQSSSSSAEEDNRLRSEVEQNLILVGLAGIYDPPRRETKASISECSQAGIKVHMLTGDHPETAKAIAKEVGIIPRNLSILPENVAASIVVKATEFDRMTDAEIDALEELPLVIARCAPDTKTRMIEALRRRGAFMAMTGDGVNDAPSLSRADVGIAMGSGSDVAKSAAKIVLTDDKFNSIVAAIREGRRMFDNIQKFVLHLLASNVGEVILLVAGLAFVDSMGFSVFPVSPLQIIWINMATSSFPAFGLGREAAAREVMRKAPQSKKRGVFTNQIIVDMIVYGLLMGACTLCTFCIVIYGANDGNLGTDCNTHFSDSCVPVFRARAATFALLTWLILISAWEFKSLRRSMFRLNPDDDSVFPFFKDVYSNRFLFWSVVIGGLSVFPVVYIPFLNTRFFKHTGISWEWTLSVGFTLVYVTGVELWKLAKRQFRLLEDGPVQRGAWGQGGPEDDGPRFKKAFSISSFKTWVSLSRRETGDSAMRANTQARSPV